MNCDRQLVWNMVAPIAALVIIPLYVFKNRLFQACTITEGDEDDSVEDEIKKQKDNVKGEAKRKYTSDSRTTGSEQTLPTTRQSRLDTDSSDCSLPSIDFNQTPYDARAGADAALGKKLKQDDKPPPIDGGFGSPPDDLDHVQTFHLPVGFYRLRKAMLDVESSFWTEVVLRDSLRYTRIKQENWSKHAEHIGSPTPPEASTALTENDFLSATRETSFLMPPTMLIKASMAYETATLTHYSPHAFTLTMTTRTPSVPFGSKIIMHTQITITNTHTDAETIDSCRMTCSCETEFPSGPPMGFGTKIKKEARLGSIATFHTMVEAIRTCVEEEVECYSNYSMGDADSFVYDLGSQEATPTLLRRKSAVGDLTRKASLTSMPSVIFADVDDAEEETTASKKKKKFSLNKRIREWTTSRKILKTKSKRKMLKKKLSRRKRFETDTDFHYVSTLFS